MTLTQILQKIKAAFYTRAEIDSMGGASLDTTIRSKANASDLNNYLPLSGGILRGDITSSCGDGEESDIMTTNPNSGKIYLYANDTNKGIYAFDSNNNGRSIVQVDSNGAVSFFGGANGIDCSVDSQGGGWIRYNSGLQICFRRSSIAANTTASFTLPKSFIDTNYVSEITNHSTNGPGCAIASFTSITKTGFDIVNTGPSAYFIDVISIGRWK